MVKVLTTAGWYLDRISGSHYIMKKAGEERAISVPVHGNRTLKIGLQKAIMRVAGLDEADL
jgi:predicted RNA binding protein YcfA (HicA-like mRNA interferase family)